MFLLISAPYTLATPWKSPASHLGHRNHLQPPREVDSSAAKFKKNLSAVELFRACPHTRVAKTQAVCLLGVGGGGTDQGWLCPFPLG